MAVEHVSRTVMIGAPIERVFALLSAPERTPEWLVGVRSVTVVTPGDIRVGTQTISDVDAFGRSWKARGRCVLLDPPTRIIVETAMGPGFRSRSDSLLEAMSASQTVLHADLAFQRPDGPLGLVFNAVGARDRIEQDFDASLRNLQSVLERNP